MKTDLSGRTFTRLLVTGPEHKDSSGRWHWRCVCACGNVAFVRGDALISGGTRSCGCWRRDVSRANREIYWAFKEHGV